MLEKILQNKTLTDKLYSTLAANARKQGINKLVIDLSTDKITHNTVNAEGEILEEITNDKGEKIGDKVTGVIISKSKYDYFIQLHKNNLNNGAQ